jgi:hypothetical protein
MLQSLFVGTAVIDKMTIGWTIDMKLFAWVPEREMWFPVDDEIGAEC